MATDPNQILATGAANPFLQGAAPTPVGGGQNIFSGLNWNNILQAARTGDPGAWSTFMQQPWAQSLAQRFATPAMLSQFQQMLAGNSAARHPYFQGWGQPNPPMTPPQVGMVPGVPGSMAPNPGAGGPIMTPGGGETGAPVMAPPQQQQGQRMSPMLPQGFEQGGGMAQTPIAGLARQPNMSGFGL